MSGWDRVRGVLGEVRSRAVVPAVAAVAVLFVEQFDGRGAEHVGEMTDGTERAAGGHVLLDADDVIIEANAPARRLLAPRDVSVGVALATAFPEASELVGWPTQGREVLAVETDDGQCVVEAKYVPFEGDRTRVRQLFENLFRNAAEHAGHDATVSVGPTEPFDTNARNDRRTRNGFFVADDGPGVPESERENVFESGFTTAIDGTGFGLAIAAKIADAHLWDVAATNGSEGGARFEFIEDFGDAPVRPR